MNETIEREELHRRQLDLRFFCRKDGLYEVEGSLLDTKAKEFQRPLSPAPIPAGTAVHDMTLRLVLDADLRVVDVAAFMRTTPFAICPGATQSLGVLKGLRIGPGWNSKVREVLRGASTCTHLRELLGPMATTALQGTAQIRIARMKDPSHASEHEAKVDSCYGYAANREVVARLWPHLHRPDDTAVPDT